MRLPSYAIRVKTPFCSNVCKSSGAREWLGTRASIGDRVVTDGYVRVFTEDGWIPEHRLVMSQALGRSLLPGESVHHKNGVRSDNRVDNLELWVTHQPAGQRTEDLLDWAYEIIRRYQRPA